MARKQVVQIQCDRCTRTETRDITKQDLHAPEGKNKVLTFGAQLTDPAGPLEVMFEDLCTPCMRTVRNHLEQIGKKMDGPSPDRATKTAESEG
jgi:hypothetical protein